MLNRASALLALFTLGAAHGQDLSAVDIPYERHVLDNGLTVILHEDHNAPQVSVNVYYKVGSRDEQPGRTGFAHLFEHLMFNGSDNFHGEYLEAIQRIGGSLNGDTWLDRTRYYQTFPNTALDRVLWLESDRMGHLLGAVTQEKLDQQRGVVQNEKRRKENRPYAQSWPRLMAGLFGEGHPYSWQTIGSMEDLDAASLEDVHAWFRAWYGAANAIVTVAGDFDPADALERVQLYFGDIPAGPPVARSDDWLPHRTRDTAETFQDRVANPLLLRGWAAPGLDHEDSTLLTLAARILGGDSSSRLHRRLVKEEKLAIEASMSVEPFELASVVTLEVLLAPGADPDAVRRIIAEELRTFVTEGPSQTEVELTQTQLAARVIKDLDLLPSKGILLAEAEFYGGSPDAYKTEFAWADGATPESIRAASAAWLQTGFHEVHVTTFADRREAASAADRSAPPAIDSYPDATAPEARDFTLKNGIRVRFVPRDGIPAVNVLGQFRSGRISSADENPAAASMAFSALRKGTRTRSADDINEELKRTGSDVSMNMGRDSARFSVSTLTSRFEAAMELAADMLRNPSFDAGEIALLKDAWITSIAQAKTSPSALAERYIRPVVYGEHPYGVAPATERDVESVSREDLRAAWQRRVRPQDLTLFVSGGIAADDLLEALNRHFGDWKSAADAAPVPALDGPVAARDGARVVIFDMPGASQSNIVAATAIDPPYREGYDAFNLAGMIFGGSFGSRINMNLREEKGWSYGVRSSTEQVVGPRMWKIKAQVQTDKTAESISELLTELRAINDARPFTKDEFENARNERVRRLSGAVTTARGIIAYFADNQLYGRPDDYLENRKAQYESVALSDLTQAMNARVDPDKLVWFISGDLEKIADEVAALGIADIEVWNADGEPRSDAAPVASR